MALQTLAYLYCTEAEIRRYLGNLAVNLRIDQDEDAIIDPTVENPVIMDSRIAATETINHYCWNKHDPLYLSQSNWINRRAVWLAAYDLCSLRLNPVPETCMERALQAEEDLKPILEGHRFVAGIPLRRTLAPVWSNTRCDPNYTFRVIRVERLNSAQHNQTSLQQNRDYTEAYTWDRR